VKNRLFRGNSLFVLILGLQFVAAFAANGQNTPSQTQQKAVRLSVDLRNAARRSFAAKLIFPVKAGPLTLVYPKWIQGEHAPTGPILDLTGLKFVAGGKEISWRRDSVDMYAFHLEVPARADELEASLIYLSPPDAGGGREVPSATAQLAVLNWYLVTLYPEGVKTDDLTYIASLRLPANWSYGTALPVAKDTGEEISFAPASLTTLIDSPVITGANLRRFDLSPGQKPTHFLHAAADSVAALDIKPVQLQHMRQLIAESGALFGARHYRRYDFLLTLTDKLQPDGIEHHESSDNRVPETTFLDPDVMETQMDLLAHEFTHSWNGKYRRPAGLVASDYQTPLKGDLLWVYEGMTQYYGIMLSGRSGMWTPDKLREYLAATAAYLNNRPGRTWRDLEDTAISSQILYSSPAFGASWRRSVDYYDEGLLIWLEADTIIRRETNGKKSLDDFCRNFEGGENVELHVEPRVVPYNFEDLVAAMNGVVAYDWKTFFSERLHTHGPGAPLGGLENSGWKLVFNETMNDHQRSEEIVEQDMNEQFTLGMDVHAAGGEQSDRILDVVPGSPAARAGLAPGMRLVAVNGRKWTPDLLRDAIQRAKNSKEPIDLLAENDDFFQSYKVDYHGGLKYPHLEAIPGKTDVLGEIAKMKAAAVGEK
jgi:predicted metalloprotease with PDZ domain